MKLTEDPNGTYPMLLPQCPALTAFLRWNIIKDLRTSYFFIFKPYYSVKNLCTFLTIFRSSIYAESGSEVCQEIDRTRLTQLGETAFSVENW